MFTRAAVIRPGVYRDGASAMRYDSGRFHFTAFRSYGAVSGAQGSDFLRRRTMRARDEALLSLHWRQWQRWMRRRLSHWILAALLLGASFAVAACPLCMGAYRSTVAEQLVDSQHAVLARPTADASGYRVVAVVKGERPAREVIDVETVHLQGTETGNESTLLFVRDKAWPMWVSVGAVSARQEGWLRQIAAGKRSVDMNADEWQARVALMLPLLENPEPLVAEIAYGELAAAPYTALLTLKSRLAAPAIRRWLADSALAARQPMYLLLLGIAGNAQDAATLEQRLDAAWEAGDATNLGSMIAADLQLRGPSRMAWVDAKYIRDRQRSTRELEAALLALSVHGNANGVIPRGRVIESYRAFMQEHRDVAGYVAQDFAAWQYWDVVPEYVALMKSGVRQQYPSRLAIVAYLRQSPGAGSIDLPAGDLGVIDWAKGAARKPVSPLPPQ